MTNTSNTTSAFAADEVAAAEANFQAAQARAAANKHQTPNDVGVNGGNSNNSGAQGGSAHAVTTDNSEQKSNASSVNNAQNGNASNTNNTSYQASQPIQNVASPAPMKSHVVAGVLAIFFGVFGIHKFYLGFTNEGFIMLGITIIGLLLSWGAAAFIVALMSVMEGLIYLIKTQKQFDLDYVYGSRKWL